MEGELIGSAESENGKIIFSLENPVLWNAESPYQYEILLETGEEWIHQKVGLKQIEVRDGMALLNGVRVWLRGVNRHDSDPVTGYTISREQARKDLALMKQHNINAIRTSHYPNAPWFPQLCSEYGFYVIGESDLETHGTVTVFNGSCENFGDIMCDPTFEKAFWTESSAM